MYAVSAMHKWSGKLSMRAEKPLKRLGLQVIILCGVVLVALGGANAENLGSLQGTVKSQGQALEGVVVVALSPDLQSQKSSLTDATGKYEIRGLSIGSYLVGVGNTSFVFSEGVGGTFKQVEVNASGKTRLDLELTPGAIITGCAEYPSKQPVVQREVIYEQTDLGVTGFAVMNFRLPVFTDDRGCFRIYGLPMGQYKVGIGKPQGASPLGSISPFSVVYYPGVLSKSESQSITLAHGEEHKLDKIVVADSPNRFSLRGACIDESTGRKLPHFKFELVRYDENGVGKTSQLAADVSGDFRVNDLIEGSYRLQPIFHRTARADYTFRPWSFHIAGQDIEATLQCNPLAAEIDGQVTINDAIAAGNQDCTIVLKEGASIDVSDGTLHRITLNNGKFRLSGLNRSIYTLIVMPLRPTLRFEQGWVGAENIRGSVAYGVFQVDLTAGDKAVKVLLKDQ